MPVFAIAIKIPTYNPPVGDDVDFVFSLGYTPPDNESVDFNF